MPQSTPDGSGDEPYFSAEGGDPSEGWSPSSGRRASAEHADDAAPGRHKEGTGGGGHKLAAWLKEIVTIVAIALVLSFLIKTFLFRAFFIPSGSMEETLQIDDRIFVNLLVPNPFDLERGDVVVFKDTKAWLPPQPAEAEGPGTWVNDALTFVGLLPDQSQQHLVKRIIGMPGDRVACCSADGLLTINGEPIKEPYIYPGASPSDTAFDVTVPEGKIWVMGDHRNASADSREHQQGAGGGFIDIADVEGKAGVIAWPLSRIGFIGSYPDVFDTVPEPAEQPTSTPVP